jgi:hypothetical protein
VPRYRLIRRPSFLDFRGVRVQFYFHRAEDTTWTFRAIADGGSRSLVIFTGPHQAAFDDALADGFAVPAGGAEERTMAVLVRLGYAECLE